MMKVHDEHKLPLAVRKIRKRVEVRAKDQNGWTGLVRDLSVKGLRAASPKRPMFGVGQVIMLEVSRDVLGEPDTVVTPAKCKWVKRKGNREKYFVAGFELTQITPEDRIKLEELICGLSGRPREAHTVNTDIVQIHDGLVDDDLGEGFHQLDLELTNEFMRSGEWLTPAPAASSSPEIAEESASEPLYDFSDTSLDSAEKRQWSRSYLAVSVPIYEEGNPANAGMIENLSEHGVGIIGMNCRSGEAKNLIIDWSELDMMGPLSFSAVCRWSTQSRDGSSLAGFEITRIPEAGLSDLRKLIRGLTLAA
jgi:hypothetical protein